MFNTSINNYAGNEFHNFAVQTTKVQPTSVSLL